MTYYKNIVSPYLLVEFDEFLDNYKNIDFIRECLQLPQNKKNEKSAYLIKSPKTQPMTAFQKIDALTEMQKTLLSKSLNELGEFCVELFQVRPFDHYMSILKKTKQSSHGEFCVLNLKYPNVDIYEEINSYCEIDKIKDQINKFNSLSKEEILLLKKNLANLKKYLSNELKYEAFLDESIELCAYKHKSLNRAFANTKITTNELENVNDGYLYNISTDVFTLEDFESYLSIWKENECMTKKEFETNLIKVANTKWYQINHLGEYNKGYWEFPTESIYRGDAAKFTFEDNLHDLYMLPYPKKFILEMVKICNSDKYGSWRMCNYLCEWYKRKLEAMEKYDKNNIELETKEKEENEKAEEDYKITLKVFKKEVNECSVCIDRELYPERYVKIPEDRSEDDIMGIENKKKAIRLLESISLVDRVVALETLKKENWDIVKSQIALCA